MKTVSVLFIIAAATVASTSRVSKSSFELSSKVPQDDPCQKDDPDDCWMSYLESPPQASVDLYQELSTRADSIAESLPSELHITGDFDVVISGGGNLDAYWMGVSMVFDRVKAVHQHRFAGASAGGMMPFEQLLKGTEATLLAHLSYAELTLLYPKHFTTFFAGMTQDRLWRLMAAWQTKKYSDLLSTLDGKVFLALSCIETVLPQLVMVSSFTAEDDQATHAFMGTGTVFQTYKGMWCSDGGAMSGKKMTPLFQDNVRPQIIVDLMARPADRFPASMALGIAEPDKYAELLRLGQDEAAEFLKSGKVARNAEAITLCSVGSKVDKNICEMSG